LHYKGIVVGVRLDTGFSTCRCMNGEMVSLGFDTLEQSCENYYNMGCRFAKWKTVFRSGDNFPT
jgi:fructose-bisphosphate aldolase class I